MALSPSISSPTQHLLGVLSPYSSSPLSHGFLQEQHAQVYGMHQQGCQEHMVGADPGRPNPAFTKTLRDPWLQRHWALSFLKHLPATQEPLVTVIRERVLVLSLRYWAGDMGWANSPLHPTGLSGIKRSQPFCWKMDVWGSPRTLPCLPQALILWVLEKSLDRGKHKQIKTSGDCSQQLCSGTMSQTTAVTLRGRHLRGHCSPGGTQRGKEPPISTSCWRMRAVGRGSGST